MWVCLKIGCTGVPPKNGKFSRYNDDKTMDFEVPYFQTNPDRKWGKSNSRIAWQIRPFSAFSGGTANVEISRTESSVIIILLGDTPKIGGLNLEMANFAGPLERHTSAPNPLYGI